MYPKSWMAGTPFEAFHKWYIAWSRDPILTGASSGKREWDWLLSYIYLEGLFQVPCFIIGAVGLYRSEPSPSWSQTVVDLSVDDKRVYR